MCGIQGATCQMAFLNIFQCANSLWRFQLVGILFSFPGIIFKTDTFTKRSPKITTPLDSSYRLYLVRYIQDTLFIAFWFLCVFISSPDPGDDDKIMAEGIGRFCEDLKLDPASLKVLVIAWKFKAATQCEFSRKEFTDGMVELGWAEEWIKYLTL